MTARGRAARLKGIRYERDIARALGAVTTRSTRPGVADDAADVVVPGWLIECRARERWSVELWFAELVGKCLEGERPALMLKREGESSMRSLVVLRLEDCLELDLFHRAPSEAKP